MLDGPLQLALFQLILYTICNPNGQLVRDINLSGTSALIAGLHVCQLYIDNSHLILRCLPAVFYTA